MMSTTFQPVRLLQYAVLIAFEATQIHLVGSLLTSIGTEPQLIWWVLLVVVAVATVATARLEPYNTSVTRIRPITALIAVVVIGWAVYTHARAIADPAGQGLLSALTNSDDDRFVAVYTALIASLAAWVRGTQVIDMSHFDMVQRFRRAIIMLVVVLAILMVAGFGPSLMPSASGGGVNTAAEIVLLLLLGFMGLSITRIVASGGSGGQAAQWQWLRSSALSTFGMLLLGLLGLALVADGAGALLREAVSWVLLVIGVILAPFLWVIFTILEFVRNRLAENFTLPQMPPPNPLQDDPSPSPATTIPDFIYALPTAIVLLIPVVVLLLAILFARRRRNSAPTEEGEERESIFSWGGFGADISRLLGALRRPRVGVGGLAGILARLTGADPALQIRRRYVQLLIKGEAADKHRRPDETPREFNPTLSTLPLDATAITTLTESYERARYAPETVDQELVTRTDEAWQQLDRSSQYERGITN